MNEYIKILLGSEDIVIRDNEDEFLNLELSRTSSEIKPSSVNNDFNLSDQYIKERNASLKFCVYGTMESKYSDCTNIVMTITTSDNDILFTPKKSKNPTVSNAHLIRTIPLSKSGILSKNVYGKEKASYFFLFELDDFQFNAKLENIRNNGAIPTNDKIFITINDPVHKVFDLIEIPFIFYDDNGDFIQYGTKTTDIDADGNTTVVDNDFPFFYDRHWIKHNIIPSKLAFVSFIPPGGVTTVPENITGGTFSGEVSLDFPSKFGRESVDVVLDLDETIRNPNQDFSFTPQTISWNTGEQIKKFTVGITDDLFVEPNEKVTFKLDNVVNANINPKTDGKFVLEIADNDIACKVNFRRSSVTVSELAKTLAIEVVLDKPMEVPGQSIDIMIDSNAGNTAILGEDFILDAKPAPLVGTIDGSVNGQSTSGGASAFGVIKGAIAGTFHTSPQNGTIFGTGSKQTTTASFSGTAIGDVTVEITVSRVGNGVGFSVDRDIVGTVTVANSKIGTATVDVVLDPPSGFQKITGTISLTLTSTIAQPPLDKVTLFFKQGDTNAIHTMEILDDFKYELDKFLTLRLNNPTQNIEIGGQTPTTKITITDSMVTNSTRYVLPASFEEGVGAFRANTQIKDEQYEWRLTNDPASFTKDFEFRLSVFNIGEDIILDNKIIPGLHGARLNVSNGLESGYQDIVTNRVFIQDFTGMTDIITLDLPANYLLDKNSHSFLGTSYQFVISRIRGATGTNSSLGLSQGQTNRYDDIEMFVEPKPASGAGQYVFYATSEISKIKATTVLDRDSTPGLTFDLTDIKINGLAFIPVTHLSNVFGFGNPPKITSIKYFFKNKPIQADRTFDGTFLPFGSGPAKDPPYADRSIELSFRNLFTQIGDARAGNSNLGLFNKQSTAANVSQGFFSWADASQRTKDEMELHIVNRGTKNIKVFGKDAGEGDTIVLRQSDIGTDFNNLHLTLDGNTSYVFSANSFNSASYAISFKNINFYDTNNTFINGPVQFPIKPFRVQASAHTLSVPVYVLVSKYEDITVGENSAGFFDCAGTIFFRYIKDIKIPGMLFSNSKTDFVGAEFVRDKDDIVPTCPTNPFRPQMLN